MNNIAADATAGTERLPSRAAFARVYTLFMTPEIVQHWQQDRVFGSQRLGGLNLMIIRRVTPDGRVGAAWPALRAKLSAKISDTAVQPFLGPQTTLQAEVNQGRLFVADYQALGDITGDQNAPGWQRGRRIMAPIVLYVRSDGFDGLYLAAIQLDQAATGADTFPLMLAAEAGQPGDLDRARNYVRDYLALYYKTDADVTDDYELQNRAKELSRAAGGPGNVPGFKPSIDSLEDLTRIVHRLIWTASAQHAAVDT